MRRLTRKQLGEAAEAQFLAVAISLGLVVAKLWGDSRPFDFYASGGNNRRPYRIQVKATTCRWKRGFKFNCFHTGKQQPYTAREIDFVAAYVVPARTWYIIPVSEVSRTTGFAVSPNVPTSRGRYERYREQWNLLRR